MKKLADFELKNLRGGAPSSPTEAPTLPPPTPEPEPDPSQPQPPPTTKQSQQQAGKYHWG